MNEQQREHNSKQKVKKVLVVICIVAILVAVVSFVKRKISEPESTNLGVPSMIRKEVLLDNGKVLVFQ